LYLKKIEIHGFKSFAEKVEIDFNKGITGIVGPNGSGKSNVIDAVRWVLGEQSPKTLRGGKMEYLIFSGTTHRKPLGMAEVSLCFDNTHRILPIDYSEVTITRRIYRSGESEYLLNKTQCRLKDIRELLMDTGIGIDGYSLIGQGQIDSILSTKSEERRQVFEEAAGIVKYKARRNDAEKKLGNTEQNLIRLDDIVNEIEDRIEPLKSQSEKAKKYLDLNGSLKKLELNLFLNEVEEIKLKLESENGQLTIVNNQYTDYISQKESLSSKQKKIQLTIDSLEKEISSMQNNFYETSSSAKKLEGEKVLYQEKIKNLEININRISKEIEEINFQSQKSKQYINKLILQEQELKNQISLKTSHLDSILNFE